MSADSNCGDFNMRSEQWSMDRERETVINPYAQQQQVDSRAMEIERLNHEIMRMKVYIQSNELDDLNEKHFRDTHPAVKDAWDQYQTVMRLAKGK